MTFVMDKVSRPIVLLCFVRKRSLSEMHVTLIHAKREEGYLKPSLLTVTVIADDSSTCFLFK